MAANIKMHLVPSHYTVSRKNGTTLFLAVTLPNANRFSKFFTNRLGNKFHEKRQLNIPSHLNRFATLPCEMYVLKKLQLPKAEGSELPCKTLPFKTVAQKYLLNDVSISVHWQKDIYSNHTEKHAE